jgi:hypothetical protein
MQINVQSKHQRMQNECAELIPVMEKAVLNRMNHLEKECAVGA